MYNFVKTFSYNTIFVSIDFLQNRWMIFEIQIVLFDSVLFTIMEITFVVKYKVKDIFQIREKYLFTIIQFLE